MNIGSRQVFNEYGDGKQDGRNDDERELFLQAALFMVMVFLLMVVIMMMFMMMMLVLVRAAITMLMCHIFAV